MRAIVDGDLIVGFLTGDAPGGYEVPNNARNVEMDRLRYDGNNVFAASGAGQYFVDERGRKHIKRLSSNWAPIMCDFDDELHRDSDGKWSVKSEAMLLSEEIRRIKSSIDAAAEQCRSVFLTAGSGQAMVYQRKADEARALRSSKGKANPDDFPILAASVGVEAKTIEEVADIVISREKAWVEYAAQVEFTRLSAKKSVEEASDIQSARAVAALIVWPKP